MEEIQVPLGKPVVADRAAEYVAEALSADSLAGNGKFGQRCSELLEARYGPGRVLVTPSCTAALELAGLLVEAGPGDEVIMPSFAFPTLASAFALRGATPVFVDVLEGTLCIDPEAAAHAVTERTVAICALNYAGLAADLPALRDVARTAGARLLEDNAHGLMASLDGQPLGGFGDLGALSFHATKNVQAGEAGALIVSDDALAARAEILQEKGTNRASFLRGETSRYEWVDVGTSALLSEVTAAVLLAQLEAAGPWTEERLAVWEAYHEALAPLEDEGLIQRPEVPAGSVHDGHLYWIMASNTESRDSLIADLRREGIGAAFHYVPLHGSPAGERWGRTAGPMPVTARAGSCLVRLPVWPGLPAGVPERVAATAAASLATPAVPPAP